MNDVQTLQKKLERLREKMKSLEAKKDNFERVNYSRVLKKEKVKPTRKLSKEQVKIAFSIPDETEDNFSLEMFLEWVIRELDDEKSRGYYYRKLFLENVPVSVFQEIIRKIHSLAKTGYPIYSKGALFNIELKKRGY